MYGTVKFVKLRKKSVKICEMGDPDLVPVQQLCDSVIQIDEFKSST